MSETKQVIVMRNDLGMRKGKMIAQGAHASMAFLTRRLKLERMGRDGMPPYRGLGFFEDVEVKWLDSSFAKICVRVDSAEAADLEVHLITDSGKTEFHGEPTETCLAIGPDFAEKIDPITGELKLL
jgi:PTH2 family peptidyl-tRNA hydrolase